ncbi:MAG: histidinol dehydrogenase [bacterium]|nr:histidinol dehydrogenase [bacterium]MDT8395129.1 histidinol dehydrogenase [bacterium]
METRGEAVPEGVMERVVRIVEDVRRKGDDAVSDYTLRFDEMDLGEVGMELPAALLEEALESIPAGDRELIHQAASAIREFHLKQVEKSWTFEPSPGVVLGQKITPLGSVGLYVPGGTAAYPSSVLMTAIPAKVAGVGQVIMVVPTPKGQVNQTVLAAAAVAGVDRVFRIGGAQAVAALAYGTETVPRVDKIVGPGNIYVAMAKKVVFGDVDIDMIAGPSEILVLADSSAEPAFAAADLLSQAEHDPLAYPVLVTDDEGFLKKTAEQVRCQLELLPRREIAAISLESRGHLILVRDMAEGAAVVNRIAPEHLELMVADPEVTLDSIQNAGAIFMGLYTAEALGDYMAGPNHVLPTGGTARFFSPLGVYDFIKRSSLIRYSRDALLERAEMVARFARLEGLEAHARAVDLRAGLRDRD